MGTTTIEAVRAGSASLPPLRSLGSAEPVFEAPPVGAAPAWSPVKVALLLFALVWAGFALLVPTTAPAAVAVADIAKLLGAGAAIVALVFATISVAQTQVSGQRPRPVLVGIPAAGIGQGYVAWLLGSGDAALWGVGAWVLVFIGVAVPLAWVGAQFRRGVRRQRVEQHANLTASRIARARHQARATVQSVHRHDVRSMLFVIDGAARTLADDTLSAEQRASFAEMLGEGVERLRALIDVRSEEIEPFDVDGVARAVVHAERKAGRAVKSDVPAQLTAVGRAADMAAVLRTLVAASGRKTGADVRLRGDVHDGAAIVRIEPAGATELPLGTEHWEEIRAETFKRSTDKDDASMDLYVVARLLADQGADVWSTTERARFAVRLPVAAVPSAQEEVA
jgi:hypothetical protein